MMKALIKRLPAEYRFRLQDIRKRWFPNAYYRAMDVHNRKMQEFYRQFLSPGDLVIDVGANLGNRVATFLKLNCKVVAVEPQVSCASFLRWKYGPKITLIQQGMSDHEGVEEFHVSDSHTISSFATDWVDAVTKSGRFEKNSWQQKAQIQMSTLDKLMQEYGHPVFIKIDVEGYEPTVIRGLKKPVSYISFEYTAPEQVGKVEECINHLTTLDPNYKCNYSTGESFSFALPQWVSPEEMKKILYMPAFMNSSNGDVYLKR